MGMLMFFFILCMEKRYYSKMEQKNFILFIVGIFSDRIFEVIEKIAELPFDYNSLIFAVLLYMSISKFYDKR